MAESDRLPIPLPYDSQPGVMGAENVEAVAPDPTTRRAIRRGVAAEFAGYLGLTASDHDQDHASGSVEDGAWLGDDRPAYEGYPEEDRR